MACVFVKFLISITPWLYYNISRTAKPFRVFYWQRGCRIRSESAVCVSWWWRWTVVEAVRWSEGVLSTDSLGVALLPVMAPIHALFSPIRTLSTVTLSVQSIRHLRCHAILSPPRAWVLTQSPTRYHTNGSSRDVIIRHIFESNDRFYKSVVNTEPLQSRKRN